MFFISLFAFYFFKFSSSLECVCVYFCLDLLLNCSNEIIFGLDVFVCGIMFIFHILFNRTYSYHDAEIVIVFH